MAQECSDILESVNFNLGNNIGIFLPNSIQYAVAYFGITFLDKIIVPIGIQAKYAEIKSTIEYCELRLIITNSQYIEILKEAVNGHKYKVMLINLDNNCC